MALLEKSSFITTDVVTPTLRLYQNQCIADTYSLIRLGKKRILIFAPTGGGKTLLGSQIARHAVDKGRCILFVVHRDILVEQTAQKLAAFGIIPGFIKSGWKENRRAQVQVASVQTMVKRDWWRQYPADIVILDEAHLTAYASVVRQMMSTVYPQAIYLGLTATPWRTNRRESLRDVFDGLVCGPMPYQLIDSGYLVKPSYFRVTEADLQSVGTTVSGDFDEAQLALACDRPELIEQAVRNWLQLAKGRRTLCYTVNVPHARHLCEAFLAKGIPSAYISGATPPKQANQIYKQLAALEIQVLASCMKLVEGLDIPSVSAELMCRPTHSPSLYFQMLGRALRLSPETGKVDSVIIDQAGNVSRHGFVEDIKEISLDPGNKNQVLEAPKKLCPRNNGGCGAMLYAFNMKCPCCGYVFEQLKKIYLVPEIGEVIRQEDADRYKFYRQKLKEAYENNFDPGWAAHVFCDKYGHWSPDSWAKGAIFGTQFSETHRTSYYSHLQTIARRKEKPDSWIQRYMTLEFGFGDLV